MKGKKGLILFLTIILPVVGLFLYYSFGENHYIRLQIFGPRFLAENGKDTIYHQVNSFSFLDHYGDTITEKTFEGKYYIADYFFTTCKTICPIMSKHMEKVQQEYLNDSLVMLLSHTVDPESDSISVLKQYAESHHAKKGKWFFVTGSKPELYNQARHGYFLTAVQGDGGPDDFIHSEKLLLIDKDRRIRGIYNGTDTKDVQRLIDEIEVLKIEYGDRKP
jgi:protein SCO1/2